MRIGVIGLGCIGGNIFRRRMKAGHSSVVWDANPAGVLSACLFTRDDHVESLKK